MKIAVSAEGKNINSDVSKVFGRAPYFVIAEISGKEVKNWRIIENLNTQRLGNVGVMTAQSIVEAGAETLITGNVGPRAFQVLSQFNVKVYSGKGKVITALKAFAEGKLEELK